MNSYIKDIQWPNANTVRSNCTQIYPLDRMLTFHFTYKGKIDLACVDNYKEFFKRNQKLQKQIMQFLIEMVQGVCSATFNLLINENCGDNDAKCYAAKNMLQNIKYLCLQVSQIIKDAQERNMKQKENRAEKMIKLTRQIADFICQEIKVYVQAIFHKYPSTPMSGYSQKLKSAIRSIDCREDYAYDCLHINGLEIVEKNNTQELISQIMEFLNKVKRVPYEIIKNNINGEEQTYEESFKKFNRNLVWIICQKQITLETIKISKQQEQKNNEDNSLFHFLVSPSQITLIKIKNLINGFQQCKIQAFIQRYEQDLRKYQREHKFLANAKISKNTLQFQENEIKNGELRFKSSSLLRVLVKWVEDLKETLNDSKKYIRDNGFKFKNISQGRQQDLQDKNLVALDQYKRRILQQAVKQTSKSIGKKNLDKINMFLVDSLIEQYDQQMPHYIFQNSLRLSSQVNAFIGKETVEQLIKLISAFSKVPQYLEQKITQYLKKENNDKTAKFQKELKTIKPKLLQQLKKVNLVSNRIGDLLRSKIFCTESQFIKLLNLLYQLDRYCKNRKSPFFKIIRIKNKLKQTTNNVLINYMFHGKLQCELQVCFMTDTNKRIEKTNVMHHFLYELTRGIYGIVPELANIVNQNDPICQRNQRSNLNLIKYSQKASRHNQFQERIISQSEKNKYVWRCMYKDCNQFSLQDSKRLMKKDKESLQHECLKCYLQKSKPSQNLCVSLKKLKYSQEDEWVLGVLEKYTDLQIQQIKEEQDLGGIYLVINPTQKKVIVKFYIVFEYYKTGKLIIKCLQQNSQTGSEFKIKEVYKEHKNKKRLFLKVNRFQLMKYFEEVQNSIDKNIIEKAQYLYKKQIRLIKQETIKQFDKGHLSKQIQNQQKIIRLNQMKSIKDELHKCFQQTLLPFVEHIYAQSIQLLNPLPLTNFHFPLNNFRSLKELHLRKNKIAQLCIQDLQFVTHIDLSYNQINKAELKNLKALEDLNLSNNQKLNQFQFSGLTNLRNLQMKFCNLIGQVTLSLESLQKLNVSYNQITCLDLQKSPSLHNVNCSNQSKIVNFKLVNLEMVNLKIDKNVALKQLEADNLARFQCLNLDQLETVKLRSQQMFLDYKLNKRYLKKLNYIKFSLPQREEEQFQLQEWEQSYPALRQLFQQTIWDQNEIGLILQQIITNQLNLKSFHLQDCQKGEFIKHLDFTQTKQQIQDILVQSQTLITLKLNTVRKLYISSKNLQQLIIQNPQAVKQLEIVKNIVSKLVKESFFQKCVNIQAITLHSHNSPESFEFTNLKFIKQVFLSKVQNLIICDDHESLTRKSTFNTSQKITLDRLYKVDKIDKIDKVFIQLSQLKQIKISPYQIVSLKLKLPLKSIKIIDFYQTKIINCEIQYYDDKQNADLEYLRVDFHTLAILKSQQFFKRVNSIKHLRLQKQGGEQLLRLSQICKNIEQFTFQLQGQKFKKIIIDIPIKVINIPQTQNTVIIFEFDKIVQPKKLLISLHKKCLSKAQFINKTEQLVEITINTVDFKLQQKFKEKNKGNKIYFTFINEEYVMHKQSKVQYLQQDLEGKLLQLGKRYNLIYQKFSKQVEEYLGKKQQNIQQYQQNDLIQKIQNSSPNYKYLLPKINNEVGKKKLQLQKQLEPKIKKIQEQSSRYEQLLEQSYKQIQQSSIREQTQSLILKLQQISKKQLERYRKQLVKGYYKQAQELIRNEQQKDIVSS